MKASTKKTFVLISATGDRSLSFEPNAGGDWVRITDVNRRSYDWYAVGEARAIWRGCLANGWG